MRIYLSEVVYKDAFGRALGILSEMHYKVQVADFTTGMIKALQSEDEYKIIDLKFRHENKGLSVSVFPGSITDDFKSISYDEKTAALFEMKLMYRNNIENLNGFRLMDEDYLNTI